MQGRSWSCTIASARSTANVLRSCHQQLEVRKKLMTATEDAADGMTGSAEPTGEEEARAPTNAAEGAAKEMVQRTSLPQVQRGLARGKTKGTRLKMLQPLRRRKAPTAAAAAKAAAAMLTAVELLPLPRLQQDPWAMLLQVRHSLPKMCRPPTMLEKALRPRISRLPKLALRRSRRPHHRRPGLRQLQKHLQLQRQLLLQRQQPRLRKPLHPLLLHLPQQSPLLRQSCLMRMAVMLDGPSWARTFRRIQAAVRCPRILKPKSRRRMSSSLAPRLAPMSSCRQ
mmetsp:Transcript_11965/g.28001  ORF Transcript_11965/g.28001 Transcript_11965/m.28001 type:complete len:282 (-) Transcript_11965:301-1146(-)